MAPQDEVIAFLSEGGSYGRPGERVVRIETHCSMVFLIGRTAYKLKRELAFSRLDYSTLALREAACRAEIALNRRTAPDLYLGLTAIRRRPGGALGFDGDGKDLEWLVVMRRFEQTDLLSHLAERRGFTPNLAVTLADEVAAFHGKAERVHGFGGAEGLRQAIEQNRRDQESMTALLGEGYIAFLYRASLERLEDLVPLLERRRLSGWVRRCHGDLRLANICLLKGRPTLFDAVEFSDQASCTDILFDAAFLMLDMHQQGLSVPVNVFFNRYLDRTGAEDGLAALPLMLSIRAGTRAYSLAGSAKRARDVIAQTKQAAAARAHMELALSLLEPARPEVIAVGGDAEDTRSRLAHRLAAGAPPPPGARIVRDHEADAPLWQAAEAVAAGYDAVLEAKFSDDQARRGAVDWARERQIPFVGLWVGSPADLREGNSSWHAVANLSQARRAVRAGFKERME